MYDPFKLIKRNLPFLLSMLSVCDGYEPVDYPGKTPFFFTTRFQSTVEFRLEAHTDFKDCILSISLIINMYSLIMRGYNVLLLPRQVNQLLLHFKSFHVKESSPKRSRRYVLIIKILL